MLDPLLQAHATERAVSTLVRLWTSSTYRLSPDEGLRRMLRLDDQLRARIDGLAIELDGGIHAKHRLTRYHDFFVERVRPGDAVLDVGCGKGELAHDLAVRAGARVTGIDFARTPLDFARAHFDEPGLEFVEADALTWKPAHDYDVVVLSSALEHFAARVELLRRLAEETHASRFLIRVPSRERDWLVPLREELGLPHFNDPGHHTEFTYEQLAGELAAAGLRVDEIVQRWGELWASAEPAEARSILAR